MKTFAILFWLPFCLSDYNVHEYYIEIERRIYDNRTMIPIKTLIYEPPITGLNRNTKEQWGTFKSKVNHFGENPGMFNMRYLYNLQFAFGNSPIIIYVGGEWEISPNALSSGIVYEIAEENKGAMFYLEHRYYGLSLPKPDLSTHNLIYHSSRQAVEDIIAFYNFLRRSENFRDSKLILVGCSYGATLATFTKQYYPNLVTGVYASSGPLYATMDMYEYAEVMTQLITKVNRRCADTISSAIAYIEQYYDRYWKWIHDKFSVCNSPSTSLEMDRAALIQRFVYHFADLVQFNPNQLPKECDRLLNATGTTAFDKFVSYFTTSSSSCAPGTYYLLPSTFASTSSSNKARAWFWQQCHEFGWSVTTRTKKQIFGKSLQASLYHSLCRSVFGANKQSNAEIDAKMNTSNTRYNIYPGQGAGLRNVVLLYGSLDPWMPMGYNRLPRSHTNMIYIPGSGHCSDLPGSTDQNIVKARAQAKALIRSWLE